MITQDKITDIFCMVDDFSKKFDMEIAKGELISSNGIRRRHRNASLSDGEIMTILIVFHFGTFANFKHLLSALYQGTSASGLSGCGIL